MKDINKKNTMGLTLASFGQCIFISLTSMALPIYFTDVIGILPSTVAMIFLVTRIWDAVNDPMMGFVVDRTHTKWGKCRPFLLYSSIPLLITTILMFTPFGKSGKDNYGIYLGIYLLFITSYTALDIPLAGIKPLLFDDPEKRNKAMSFSSTFGSLGSLLAVDLFFILVELIGGSNVKLGYLITVILLALLGFGTLIAGFFTTKEVIPTQKKRTSFIKSIKYVSKNKPMVFIILTTVVSVGISGYGLMMPYFAKWNLADSFSFGGLSVQAVMIPILSTVTGIIFMIAVLVTPYLLKFTNKKNLFFISSVVGILLNMLSFFLGFSNLYLFIAVRFFAHIPTTITSVVAGYMFADTLDYSELQNGERTEGISYAVNNLINKGGNAVFNSILLLLLGIFGYNIMIIEPSLNIGESIIHNYNSMLNGIFMMMTIFPAISCAIQIIPMLFYKLSDKEHKEIIEKLKTIRLEKEESINEEI